MLYDIRFQGVSTDSAPPISAAIAENIAQNLVELGIRPTVSQVKRFDSPTTDADGPESVYVDGKPVPLTALIAAWRKSVREIAEEAGREMDAHELWDHYHGGDDAQQEADDRCEEARNE